jgi:hypothetical protein
MGKISEGETATEKSARRISTVQRWLTDKSIELRRGSFYGELSVTLKFEDGQCVLGEQVIREKAK